MSNLIAHLPFDNSTTEDLCGNTWTATGNPAIENGALVLDGSSYLRLDGSLTLGGQDFTINGWFNISSATPSLAAIFTVYEGTTRFLSCYVGDNSIWLRANEQQKRVSFVFNTLHHLEVDYSHATGKTRLFIDGTLATTITQTLSRRNLSFVALGNGTWNGATGFVGTIDDFRIYDGVALHTEDFTPPTEQDVEETFSVECRLANRFELSFDLVRDLSKRIVATYPVERQLINRVETVFAVERNVLRPDTFLFPVTRQILRSEELAFDVELQTVVEGLLMRLLPDSILDDPKLNATAQALDVQIFKVLAVVKDVLHLPRLDELSGTLLDILAWAFHVDFYEPLYLSDEQKRQLIRRSVDWHRRRGTVSAVEDLCAAVFSGVQIEEWMTYGGKPYTFRLATKSFARSEDDWIAFKKMIHIAKNVRSHLDSITVDCSPEEPLSLSVALAQFKTGNVTLKRSKPSNLSLNVKVGTHVHKSGTITLTNNTQPMRFNLRLTVKTARLLNGHIVLKPRGGSADIFDDDPLPEDFIGSFIWFRWFAPSGKRGMKLRNARSDLTKQDLQDVSDYLIQNQVLLNSKGDPLQYAVRASVARIDEQHLIKTVQRS